MCHPVLNKKKVQKLIVQICHRIKMESRVVFQAKTQAKMCSIESGPRAQGLDRHQHGDHHQHLHQQEHDHERGGAHPPTGIRGLSVNLLQKVFEFVHAVCFNWDRLIGTISKFWKHCSMSLCLYVCLCVCGENLGIDIKKFTVSQLNHTGCSKRGDEIHIQGDHGGLTWHLFDLGLSFCPPDQAMATGVVANWRNSKMEVKKSSLKPH